MSDTLHGRPKYNIVDDTKYSVVSKQCYAIPHPAFCSNAFSIYYTE
jgi:hypothetical protein